MAIGTSGSSVTWAIYTAPPFYIDGKGAMCIDGYKDYPTGQTYDETQVNYNQLIANTAGTQSVLAEKLLGVAKVALDDNPSLNDPVKNVKIYATMNALLGTFNMSTLQSYADSYVNRLLAGANTGYQATARVFIPRNSNLQRLLLIAELAPSVGYVRFRKNVLACEGHYSGRVDYRDWAVDVYSGSTRVGRYTYNSNFQTSTIELPAGNYTYREVRVQNYSTANVNNINTSGSFTIVANQTINIVSSVAIVMFDCPTDVDLEQITQVTDTENFVLNGMDDLICRMKLLNINDCNLHTWVKCEMLPRFRRFFAQIFCYLRDMVNKLNRNFTKIEDKLNEHSDLICCLQEQFNAVNGFVSTRTITTDLMATVLDYNDGVVANTMLSKIDTTEGTQNVLNLQLDNEEEKVLKKNETLEFNLPETYLETAITDEIKGNLFADNKLKGEFELEVKNHKTLSIKNVGKKVTIPKNSTLNANFTWFSSDEQQEKGE